jgi:hypothetical protein
VRIKLKIGDYNFIILKDKTASGRNQWYWVAKINAETFGTVESHVFDIKDAEGALTMFHNLINDRVIEPEVTETKVG